MLNHLIFYFLVVVQGRWEIRIWDIFKVKNLTITIQILHTIVSLSKFYYNKVVSFYLLEWGNLLT